MYALCAHTLFLVDILNLCLSSEVVEADILVAYS